MLLANLRTVYVEHKAQTTMLAQLSSRAASVTKSIFEKSFLCACGGGNAELSMPHLLLSPLPRNELAVSCLSEYESCSYNVEGVLMTCHVENLSFGSERDSDVCTLRDSWTSTSWSSLACIATHSPVQF